MNRINFSNMTTSELISMTETYDDPLIKALLNALKLYIDDYAELVQRVKVGREILRLEGDHESF